MPRKMGRGRSRAASRSGVAVMKALRQAKEDAETGRLYDELHYAEGRLARAFANRKSSFTSKALKTGTAAVKQLMNANKALQKKIKELVKGGKGK